MDPVSLVVTALVGAATNTALGVARALIATLWKAYKSKAVLGALILTFTAGGAGLIFWSHAVTGWTQIALLGFGTSLAIVGTVELGLLGVLRNIIEPDHTAGEIEDFYRRICERFDALDGRISPAAAHATVASNAAESTGGAGET